MKLINIITGLAFAADAAAYSCYSGGFVWNSQQRLESLDLANGWCDKLGRRAFAAGEQVKECLTFDNGRHKLMVRIKSGYSYPAILEPVLCRSAMALIVRNCDRGGADDSSPAWRPR
ncbi:hypothetical protein DM02DRAFT_615752 [Periconia macrospinosa]|uniref:Uncharacterized protein n=1 Tax=Periconia macrospinosa TaxID=97972 RepID=A0A2V1DK16_9PLEO|nr:hypothetical protein DM02DRAFT_615752 [Periconia macrospinosa]